MILQSCLGLRVDGLRGEIHVVQPMLPVGIDKIVLRHLFVGNASANIIFQRVGERVVTFPCGKDSGAVPLFIHA
jgi:hypothetical protein